MSQHDSDYNLSLRFPQGAGALSEFLLATFGRNAFALIVDEGGISTPFPSFQ